MVPGRVFADGYIVVLKIQMGICKHGAQVKVGTFKSTISIWSLSHKPTTKATIKIICPLLFFKVH